MERYATGRKSHKKSALRRKETKSNLNPDAFG